MESNFQSVFTSSAAKMFLAGPPEALLQCKSPGGSGCGLRAGSLAGSTPPASLLGGEVSSASVGSLDSDVQPDNRASP